jgi:hypothetical protein
VDQASVMPYFVGCSFPGKALSRGMSGCWNDAASVTRDSLTRGPSEQERCSLGGPRSADQRTTAPSNTNCAYVIGRPQKTAVGIYLHKVQTRRTRRRWG